MTGHPNPSRTRVLLATAGYDHTIRFWDAPSGNPYRTLQYNDSQVNCMEITPDKQYLAAAGNSHVRLFEINSNNPNPYNIYDGHSSNVTGVGFQNDSLWMYTGSEDGTIKIWDIRAAGCQRQCEVKCAVNSLVLHPNQGEIIAGDQSGTIRVWDLTANKCRADVKPQSDIPIRSVTISSDGSMVVVANNNGRCFVWRGRESEDVFASPVPSYNFQAHDTYVLKCLLSPNDKLLATTSADHTIKIWDTHHDSEGNEEAGAASLELGNESARARSPEPHSPHTSRPHTPPHTAMAAHNPLLATPSQAQTQSSNSNSMSNSNPTNNTTATATHSHTHAHSPSPSSPSGERRSSLGGLGCRYPGREFRGSGKPFTLDKILTGHQRWVWDCVFSVDAAYLVSASSDHTARLWDLVQGETIRHYSGHQKALTCVALNDCPPDA